MIKIEVIRSRLVVFINRGVTYLIQGRIKRGVLSVGGLSGIDSVLFAVPEDAWNVKPRRRQSCRERPHFGVKRIPWSCIQAQSLPRHLYHYPVLWYLQSVPPMSICFGAFDKHTGIDSTHKSRRYQFFAEDGRYCPRGDPILLLVLMRA